MEALRTPDDRFADLPDFPYEPRYLDLADGLRASFVEDGPADGETVVLLHGEPSWSFLYRRMIPVLARAGLRVVAPDLIGFGRSDKPVARDAYSYAAHVAWTRELLFDRLDLRDVTLVGQDWGGLIGLRLVAEHPDRFARVVAANTGLPTGDQPMSEAFLAWQRFSQESPEFQIGRVVANGCATPLAPEVVAAYDAPFPDDRYTAGARVFPALVPTRPDDPAAAANRAAWEVLTRWDRPFLTAFSDGDPITGGGDRVFRTLVPGAQGLAHTTLAGGGHFLQEDVGPELARVVVDLIASTPR
ncbi:MAG: Hydrolase, alpha/beta fold family protein, At1g52510/AT4G12830 homolog, group4 [uncultured Blastococcus sp.]|uniref:Hydrolase, alpha/beta fold family protein, At1g52510/AT4G12830 homolog, group4 n=1 Tax=uncultured Blastococcus sp. TaxID=217144 RepID=A0A6J4IB69_9ACTN|nr:MAG: Hydrolase, alpha/beta fold family protein, At1g52510/AT4G12830 homolog, group4 [uncultured Blastococcus sp.]